jgi:SAM-dependent MidA family methyltransferase
MSLIAHSLPAPSKDDHQRIMDCIHILCQKMNQKPQQALPFSAYMETVLYHHQVGYYSTKPAIFGTQGDFYTATAFPAFNAALTHYLHRFLPFCSTFVEIGPGLGTFANFFLKNSQTAELYLSLLEKSSSLIAYQKKHLSAYKNLNWITDVSECKTEKPIMLFANELCDAFPVDKIMWNGEYWLYSTISWDATKKQLQESFIPLKDNPELYAFFLKSTLPSRQKDLPPGYITELSVALDHWLQSLSKNVHAGWLLLIDYGDTEADRYNPYLQEGSLRCFYQHHIHNNPLAYPGIHDLSTDVDFSLLSQRAESLGWITEDFSTQAAFLLAQGINEYADNNNPNDRQHLHTLLSPTEMGDRIKVLLLSKNIEKKEGGLYHTDFSLYSLMHRLSS